RKNMPARSSARYYDFLVQLFLFDLLVPVFVSDSRIAQVVCAFSSPSNFSTFLATLNMMPIAKQVNRNELPPILINGSVTPVTGNKFTLTAIFAIAWMARVKLKPKARNAPNAKGHFLKMRMLLKRKIR